MCVHIFSSVWVAERPPFGQELFTRLTICSLCIMTICNVNVFRFGFEGLIWVLIASVPGLHTFYLFYYKTLIFCQKGNESSTEVSFNVNNGITIK